MTQPDLMTVGLEELVKASFELVAKEAFQTISQNIEVFIEQNKLLTVGRSNFTNYIVRTVGVFPLFGTSRFAFVDNVYTDVGITDELEHEKYRSTEEIQESLLNQKSGKSLLKSVSLSPLDAIASTNDGFALLGTPGAGKTTTFRHIAISAAKGVPIRNKKRIPIYLAVRDMSLSEKSRSIEQAAVQLFERLEIGEPSMVFNALIKGGHCIILLDGLDETEKSHQISLITELAELYARYPKSIFCVSARQHSLTQGITGFTKWQTLPLSFKSRLSFVKKWFDNVNPDKGIRLLENCSRRPEILDLGSSPLLLSIVCALYNNDLDIPTDTDELYARCTEGLLGAWDTFRNIARKSVLANFSIRKRIILVTWLAASLFEKGKIVFSIADVDDTQCLQRASEMMRQQTPSAEELLETLECDFGILVKRAPRLYSFSHLTLQEYLVALYTVDNRREINLLSSFARKKEWFEIINIVAKMLPNADEYMKALHKFVRFEEEYEVRLLHSVWSSRPICTPETRIILFTEFASQVSHIAKRVPVTYEVDGSTLLVYVNNLQIAMRQKVMKLQRSSNLLELEEGIKDNSKDRYRFDDDVKNAKIKTRSGDTQKMPKRKRMDPLTTFMPIMNLPFLIDIINESGFSYDNLRCSKNILFLALEKTSSQKITSVKLIC